jgi:hypothetical protein
MTLEFLVPRYGSRYCRRPSEAGVGAIGDNWRAVQVVLILQSVTAGSVDVIGFLGLDGLFIAHITGDLVILAAHIAANDEARLANIISFPYSLSRLP